MCFIGTVARFPPNAEYNAFYPGMLFVKEGVSRASVVKDDEVTDQILYGLFR